MVSRQAAVNIANDLIISVSGYEQHNHAVNSYSAELMKLPSAEPEYKELQDWKTDFKGFIDALDMPRDDYCGIMEYIDEVPSAEPERKKGKWIPHKSIFGGLGEKVYTCDQCGYNIGFHTENFCPRCGSYNGGEQDDSV